MIDFGKTFGAGSQSTGAAASTSNRADQPKAKIWLNIGYVVENVPVTGSTTGETESRFVSLPVGIPLDTMQRVDTRSRNAVYAQFQAARNDLYEQLMASASTLKPGEDMVFGVGADGLCIQIRHVNDEREEVVADENNPFAIKLALKAD